jgi:hypothetical protein
VCSAKHVLAMDSATNYASLATAFTGMGFPGFAYLTELDQYTEYRDMSERTASEMTRKWIKLRSTSEEDRSDEIKKLDAEIKRLHLRELFRKAAEMDGKFGRAQIFIDLGEDSGSELSKPLMLNKLKIGRGKLRNLKMVEPVTTYPKDYNSLNPLAADYYTPSSWYVYGQEVHSSRLLTFISRPVPDMLKPAYNFSGMSLSQLAQPYVDYWFSTRDSVGRLLKNFSTKVLKTNMQDVLAGGDGDEVLARAKLYTQLANNQNIFLLDNKDEDFAQFSTPITGLSQLQAQAQEHMAAVAKTPLVVLLGVTPSGLNANSDGEIRVYYDYIADQQEKLFRPNLEILLKVIQLNLFGEVYDDIEFEFVSLFALDAQQLSAVRASDATAGVALIDAGVISPEEERVRIAKNPDSGYDNLDLKKKIEPPAPKVAPSGGGKVEPKSPGLPALTQKVGDEAIGTDEFFGNQHTGVINAAEDGPYAIATKSSAVAANATATAVRDGTKRSHERAAAANQRALDAHTAALDDPSTNALNDVFKTYIQTHAAYIKMHEDAAAELQAKIDAWGGDK